MTNFKEISFIIINYHHTLTVSCVNYKPVISGSEHEINKSMAYFSTFSQGEHKYKT